MVRFQLIMMSSYAKNKLQMCSVTQRRIAPFWVHVIPADPPWCETLPTHFTQRKRKRKGREVHRRLQGRAHPGNAQVVQLTYLSSHLAAGL